MSERFALIKEAFDAIHAKATEIEAVGRSMEPSQVSWAIICKADIYREAASDMLQGMKRPAALSPSREDEK